MEGVLRAHPAVAVREVRGPGARETTVRKMSTTVVVSLEGNIVMEVALSKPVTVVGRHPDCDIRFDHPAVSLRHALFRIVDRTVYLEDLASTNGTLTNGIPTSSRVLHHLDLIQIGLHKLHVFDDSLLAGGVGDLEHTILDASEATMLAPVAGREVAPQALQPADPEDTDNLAHTDPFLRGDAGTPQTPPPLPQAPVAPAADTGIYALRNIKRRGGEGEIITLERANTLIGTVGVDTALIVKRGKTLFLSQFAAHGRPRLNGLELGPGAHEIVENDRIQVGESLFEVIRMTDEPSWNMGT